MHYRGKFTFLYIPHLAEEAELMLKNLLTYLHYLHSDIIYEYFMEEARVKVIGDKWDDENKRIIYDTDEFMKEDDGEDIGLERARLFLNEQKKQFEIV